MCYLRRDLKPAASLSGLREHRLVLHNLCMSLPGRINEQPREAEGEVRNHLKVLAKEPLLSWNVSLHFRESPLVLLPIFNLTDGKEARKPD